MTVTLRVATFNIRTSAGRDGDNAWPLRRNATAEAIEALNADVLGLQEVLPDQLAFLRWRFPDCLIVGEGRNGGGGGEHSPVMVPRGTWRIESHETRWLSLEPWRPGSKGWDAALPRIATLARLRHEDGTRVGVANTHFDHKGGRARVESARLLVQWVAQEPDRHWVMVGDLNAVPGSEPLHVLTDAGWRGALPVHGGGTEHSFSGATDRKQIDHVLVGPDWQIDDAHVSHLRPGGRLPSDHWPVVAALRLVDPKAARDRLARTARESHGAR